MPKIVDKDEQRRRIAREAIGYFREVGYNRANLRELARRCDISKSGMYHYFPSKENLFVYCGDFMVNQAQSAAFPHTVGDDSGEPQRIEALVQLAMELRNGFIEEMALLAEFRREQPVDSASIVQKTIDGYRGILSAVLGPELDGKCGDTVLRLILGDCLLAGFGIAPRKSGSAASNTEDTNLETVKLADATKMIRKMIEQVLLSAR